LKKLFPFHSSPPASPINQTNTSTNSTADKI
jgi:hypothetical protein